MDSVPASAPALRVKVYVVWNRDGSEARQVGVLRRLIPELQNRLLAELMSAAAMEETSLVGEFPDWQAKEKQILAGEAGVTLRVQE
jgi:hypothetical protein